MEKIVVNLCLGTTCFVMGSGKLQDLPEILSEKYGDRVEVAAKTCLDLCSSGYSNAPYVKVNERIVTEATVEKVIDVIEDILSEETDNE